MLFYNSKKIKVHTQATSTFSLDNICNRTLLKDMNVKEDEYKSMLHFKTCIYKKKIMYYQSCSVFDWKYKNIQGTVQRSTPFPSHEATHTQGYVLVAVHNSSLPQIEKKPKS